MAWTQIMQRSALKHVTLLIKRSLKSLENAAKIMAYLTKFWKINYENEMPGHQDIQADKQDPGNLLAACGLGRSTSIFDGYVAKYMKTTKAPKISSKKAGNNAKKLKPTSKPTTKDYQKRSITCTV